jgi:hypothetical protein
MNRLETARISAKLQMSQDLFDVSEEQIPDCGFASFMRSHIEENWEILDYERLDLAIDAYSLVALPTYDSSNVHFGSILARVTKDI